MPSYDCKSCDIRYPATLAGAVCPICTGTTIWNYAGAPDEDWQTRLNVSKGVFTATELPLIDSAYISETRGPTHDRSGKFQKQSQQHWIAGAVLERDGYPGAQELDIIRVRGKSGSDYADIYFELVGKTVKDIPGTLVKGWMIERVEWDGAAAKLTPAMFEPANGYGSVG